MMWDQHALEAWLEESARRDEDALVIQKFKKQDDSKIKELQLSIEKLTDERNMVKLEKNQAIIQRSFLNINTHT